MKSLLFRNILVAALALIVVFSPSAGAPARAEAPIDQTGFDWYRYQGASDSGPLSSINCEVTSITMAIQYAKNNLKVPISAVREVIGHNGLTTTGDAERALTHYGVPFQGLRSVDEIMDALGRGHIVIAGMIMSRVSLGADYQKSKSPPALRFGRYYAYDGAHSVIIKGATEDKGWFIVYDPDVWDGNPTYWYSDGTPKGKDRYYPVGEVSKAMAALGDPTIGLEILAVPTVEPATGGAERVQQVSAVQDGRQKESPPPVVWPRQSSDVGALGSLVKTWKSVTLTFRMLNPRSAPLQVAQVGLQGRDPAGREFFAAQGPLTLEPGSDLALAIPMAVSEPGVWRVYRILYFAEGQWHELPASGFIQQMAFIVR